MAVRRTLLLAILLLATSFRLGGQAAAGGPPLPTPPCLPYAGC